MTITTLSIGHYGHPLLRGAKHWSFLFFAPDSSGYATAYQVGGSTYTYALNEPEIVQPMKSRTFMGRVDVGRVESTQEGEFYKILDSVPITRGDVNWNCQNWIILALRKLKDNGYDVDVYTKEELAAKLASAPRA